jgi:hypothetical protein
MTIDFDVTPGAAAGLAALVAPNAAGTHRRMAATSAADTKTGFLMTSLLPSTTSRNSRTA